MGREHNLIEMVGKTFGRLTVLYRDGVADHHAAAWRCWCLCGTEKTMSGQRLRNGSATSCGCFMREGVSSRDRTHGQSNSPTWTTWHSMHLRCGNPNATGYQNYGGRGIRICKRWASFESFLADMGYRPSGTSLDRVDVNGNYDPDNCRWATRKQQGENRRGLRIVEYEGRSMSLSQWSRETGIDRKTLRTRLCAGWSAGAALTVPVRPQTRPARRNLGYTSE